MRYFTFIVLCILINPFNVSAGSSLIVRKAEKEITLTGYTRNIKSQSVSSETSGKVLRVNYDIGQTAGSVPFIEIDYTFIDFQIKSTGKSLEKLGIIIKKAESKVNYLEKESLRIENLFKDDMALGGLCANVIDKVTTLNLPGEKTWLNKRCLLTPVKKSM